MHKIQLAHFSTFATYNQKMNAKLFAAAETLTEADLYADKKAFFGSVFKTLQHILGADLIWLRRFQEIPSLSNLKKSLIYFPEVKRLDADLASSLAELGELRRKLDQIILDSMKSLAADDLNQNLRYKNMSGREIDGMLWTYLTHFFNHQTHHRGQATTLLHQMGIDVGLTDFHMLV